MFFDDDIHHNLPRIVQRIGEQRWLPPRFGFQFIIVTNCSIIITVVIIFVIIIIIIIAIIINIIIILIGVT